MGAGGDEEDERFQHISRDPKFKRIPYETRKVKIDKRFQSMFKDEKFKVKYNVDKRGFPIKPQTNADDFKKFYNLDAKAATSKESSAEESGEEEEEEEEEEQGGDSDASVDYARGIGVQHDADSSSDEESSEDEAEEDRFQHEWGELDQDAERTEEVTHRLAVMHMDWDRIKAKDLMVLFNSFLPQGGAIKSVNIYPSEFGKQRMAEEEVKGPLELVEHSAGEEEGEGEDGGAEGSAYHREKLRQYQLNRLKYYYAVVTCDSPESAGKVYSECDGMEYESSATRVDLRFIPDDTQFDEEPKESCTELPDLSKYKPRHFMNSALQQVKVSLTWDETDPDRLEAVSQLMSGEASEATLKTYLATSSEEEEDDTEDTRISEPTSAAEVPERKQDVINKYRSLLRGITEAEEQKKQEVEMEISWGVGLEEKAKEVMREKKKKELTPFQQLLAKKKEKRKKKRLEKEKEEQEEGDDDIPSDVDLSDPYFKEELDALKAMKGKKKTAPRATQQRPPHSSDSEEGAQARAGLELLLMGEGEGGAGGEDRHFSMRAIQEREEEEGGRRRKKKKKSMKNYKKKKLAEKKEAAKTVQDGFEVDVVDPRFSAVYSSHHYNIDPADPHYHRTQAMQAIIQEKQKRRRLADNEPDVSTDEGRPKKKR